MISIQGLAQMAPGLTYMDLLAPAHNGDTGPWAEDGTFILSFSAVVSSCFAGILVYFLKSRCTSVRFCGVACERQPVSEEYLANARTTETPV